MESKHGSVATDRRRFAMQFGMLLQPTIGVLAERHLLFLLKETEVPGFAHGKLLVRVVRRARPSVSCRAAPGYAKGSWQAWNRRKKCSTISALLSVLPLVISNSAVKETPLQTESGNSWRRLQNRPKEHSILRRPCSELCLSPISTLHSQRGKFHDRAEVYPQRTGSPGHE